MSAKRDYYEILELAREADLSEIKRAYRKKALDFHPDRNPDPAAEERFKEASEAYEVLSDAQKRRIYDQFGHAGLDSRGFHGFDRVDDIFASFGDIFEEFFGDLGGFGFGRRRGFGGQGRGGQGPRRGSDVEAAVVIEFEEMVSGVKKEITVHKEGACDVCGGKGSKTGKKNTCSACGGTGHIAHAQGFFMIQTLCSRCQGAGEFLADLCEECRGQGKVRKKKNLGVKIPAGIEDGIHLVLRGEGSAGTRGGPQGDLYVAVRVKPHGFFERKGDDIHCTVPVSMPQAALGAKVSVSTLEGPREVSLPEGVDTGEEIRLKKMGLPNLRSGKRGDQIIRIVVKTPKNLSREQRKLLEELIKS